MRGIEHHNIFFLSEDHLLKFEQENKVGFEGSGINEVKEMLRNLLKEQFPDKQGKSRGFPSGPTKYAGSWRASSVEGSLDEIM